MNNILILSFIGLALLGIYGCSSQPEAELSDTVKIKYVATLENGTVIDSTQTDNPMELVIGDGKIFPPLEESLIGLSAGDTITVTLSPEQGFGNRRDDLIGKIPRSAFPDTVDLKVGMSWQVPSADGIFYASIVGLETDSVLIDSNHPLAGETVTYQFKLIEIIKAE